ncbi:MAG TPA: hypothetical protein VEH05_17695 [Streptosporangiaceae bacterium]|nr:hypothetical protein [Streptosporangiaceae bacterium]
MADVLISFVGEANSGGYGDLFPFKPCLMARFGDHEVRVWVHVDGMTGEIAHQQLELNGYSNARELLKRAMLQYGAQRLEALLQEMHTGDGITSVSLPDWKLEREDRPLLLSLATRKKCDYQAKLRRDLFCTIPAANDATAIQVIDGRASSPTSRPICYECDLPDSSLICSHLLHPATMGFEPPYSRRVARAICDLGRSEIADPANCRLGGHSCAQRILELEGTTRIPQLSALSVPESLDVLDAHWRLAFGKSRRLLTLSTLTGPSSLSMDCTSRAEFESRLSSLSATIDRLKVDDDLIPDETPAERTRGSLNRLEICLTHKLPPEQHQSVRNAIQVLRRIHQARSSDQHGLAKGGLTEALARLGITDAPPNWKGAWDTIRARTTDALTAIRQELRQWIDAQDS